MWPMWLERLNSPSAMSQRVSVLSLKLFCQFLDNAGGAVRQSVTFGSRDKSSNQCISNQSLQRTETAPWACPAIRLKLAVVFRSFRSHDAWVSKIGAQKCRFYHLYLCCASKILELS